MKEIVVNSKKYGTHIALVDDEDFDELNKCRWHLHRDGTNNYARRDVRVNGKRSVISMHRQVLGITDPKILGDHKDLNGLNNQKNNLRVATRLQNCSNTRSRKNSTSKYLGVNVYTEKYTKGQPKKYKAQINTTFGKKHLGYFPFTKEGEMQAALKYNQAALQYHGEFANINFID